MGSRWVGRGRRLRQAVPMILMRAPPSPGKNVFLCKRINGTEVGPNKGGMTPRKTKTKNEALPLGLSPRALPAAQKTAQTIVLPVRT